MSDSYHPEMKCILETHRSFQMYFGNSLGHREEKEWLTINYVNAKIGIESVHILALLLPKQ